MFLKILNIFSQVELIDTMLPPKKRQENRQSQEVSDPIPDPPAGDHLDDVQEPIPEPSDDTLSDSSSGSSLEPGSESQMFHQDSPPSPRGTQCFFLISNYFFHPTKSL